MSGKSAHVAGVENENAIVARSSDGINFNTTSVAAGASPDVAASGNNVYAVWTDENEIFIAASSNGGVAFGEKESLGGEGFWPAVAADGGVYVAWTQDFDIMVAAQS
ncbi:MAG TPA: hypothetical protein VD736_06615 [Nitrososphaera sp.]|nr:hypothetical protein [Nitrososphaera sp.]